MTNRIDFGGDAIFDKLTTGTISINGEVVTFSNTGTKYIYGNLVNKRIENGARVTDVPVFIGFNVPSGEWRMIVITSPPVVNMDTVVSLGIDVLAGTSILDNSIFQSFDTGNEPTMPNSSTVIIDGYPEHDTRVSVWNNSILRAGRSKLPGVYLDKVSDSDFTGSLD